MNVLWRYREISSCLTPRVCGLMFGGVNQYTTLGSNHQPDDTFWSNTFHSWTSSVVRSAARLRVSVSLLLSPRDAMHKRGLCRHVVSVCLSVTFVDHVKTNIHIFEIFLPSRSHTILVFPYKTGWRYFDGNPPNRASNAGGVYAEMAILF